MKLTLFVIVAVHISTKLSNVETAILLFHTLKMCHIVTTKCIFVVVVVLDYISGKVLERHASALLFDALKPSHMVGMKRRVVVLHIPEEIIKLSAFILLFDTLKTSNSNNRSLYPSSSTTSPRKSSGEMLLHCSSTP